MSEVARFANRVAAGLRTGVCRLLRPLAAYARSRKAGAMIVTGAFVLITMVVGGAGMSNYAWREAQWEDLRSATRAAVAAAGALLATAGTTAGDDAIAERVAGFMAGLMPGLTVDPNDIVIAKDADDVVSVTVSGRYAFHGLFGDSGGTAEVVTTAVRVQLEVTKYEVAIAVDVSGSMANTVPSGITKLQALKNAFATAAAAMQTQAANDPGSIMVSVVPFGAAVNVADTEANGSQHNKRTEAKERYVRMLAGVRDTMAETLVDAKAAADAEKRVHWVDTFRHYGMSAASPLNYRHLPSGVLDNTDWNLRATNVNIDVSEDVPNMNAGVWTVDDEDFWSGCVMARWGAHWDSTARPTGWSATDSSTWKWPATKAVAGWSPNGPTLPDTTPLHLSDEPPVATNPNTLFTAYSWPDARIGSDADQKLQLTMLSTMFPTALSNYVNNWVGTVKPMMRDIHWSRTGNSGRMLCPSSPITPLSDNFTGLIASVNALAVVPGYVGDGQSFSSTLAVRGVVWALRTLSPLWQGVWNVADTGGRARPGVPCSPDDTGNCDARLHKSIFLITDGETYLGPVWPGRLLRGTLPPHARNPSYAASPICTTHLGQYTGTTKYFDAAIAGNATAFNNLFKAGVVGQDLVDGNGNLNGDGSQRVAEAILIAEGTDCTTEATRCAAMAAALDADPPTPWELFHELEQDAIDILMDTAEFSFTGRPTLLGHMCRPISPFTVYGRAGDVIDVGDGTRIAGKAPFEFASLHNGAIARRAVVDSSYRTALRDRLHDRLNTWTVEACRLANDRGVRIHGIYIGRDALLSRSSISKLEDCVDAAGGTAGQRDVHIVPTAAELESTIVDLLTIRRNLRFL